VKTIRNNKKGNRFMSDIFRLRQLSNVKSLNRDLGGLEGFVGRVAR
jgi:hypothetical protein